MDASSWGCCGLPMQSKMRPIEIVTPHSYSTSLHTYIYNKLASFRRSPILSQTDRQTDTILVTIVVMLDATRSVSLAKQEMPTHCGTKAADVLANF